MLVLVLLLAGCASRPTPPAPGQGPLISIDTIGADHATLTVLARQDGRITLETRPLSGASPSRQHRIEVVAGEPALLRLDELAPDSTQRLTWRFDAGHGPVTGGGQEFNLAPSRARAVPVRLAFGGDLGGQNVCRDAQRGYPIFDVMSHYEPDFFVALGDMIYADGVCEARGRYGNEQVPGQFAPADSAAQFAAHWNYQFDDEAFARFRANVPWYLTWDDHEVINDFDPGRDFRTEDPGRRLMADGAAAAAKYGGIDSDKFYRSVRWGKHLELFILDTRSYREANATPDLGREPKTLLGAAQREWLVAGLRRSDATWKLVATSVPLAIPTGTAQADARDGWADGDTDTGFERELLAILTALDQAGVENLLFISADVHFATVFAHRLPEGNLRFDEFVVGPLNAGVFPTEIYDRTLQPQRLFFHGPPRENPIGDFDEAMHWFNFGLIDIAADGTLHARIVNARGDEVFELRRAPASTGSLRHPDAGR